MNHDPRYQQAIQTLATIAAERRGQTTDTLQNWEVVHEYRTYTVTVKVVYHEPRGKTMTFKQLLEKHEKGRISDKTLEKARQNLQEYNTAEGWWETITEEWKEALHQIGFPNAEIYFSGFSSQGDGACFTCKYVNASDLLDFLGTKRQANPAITSPDGKTEDFRGWILHKLGWKGQDHNHRYEWLTTIADQISATVTHHGHYNHEQSCSLTAEFYGPETVETAVEEFQKDAEDLRRYLSKAIYKDLESQYDYLNSDQGLQELDIELDSDGEIMRRN